MCCASAAMVCCLLLLCTCKFSIQVQDIGQFGFISYIDTNSTTNQCVSYLATNASLYVDMNRHFRMAQVSAFIVIPTGFILMVVLFLTPFSRRLNGIWSRLLSVTGALIAGIIQLLSVVKFIRYFLHAYDGVQVRYQSRMVVYGSIVFWLLTAITVSLCGVKQKVEVGGEETASKEGKTLSWKIVEQDDDLNVTIEHDDEHDGLEIVKSFSDGTRDTRDLEDGIDSSFETP